MSKSVRSSVVGTFHPLADVPLANADGLGNVTLGPTLLFQPPGLEPSSFFLVARAMIHA
jgi:hypothetical protein